MVRLFLKIFFIILAALFQFVLMPILNIKGFFPNLILIGAVVLMLLDFETDAFWLAGLGGLLLDLGGPIIFGFNTIFGLLIVFLMRFLVRRFFPQINFWLTLIIIFLISALYAFLSILILKEQLSTSIFIVAFYGGILGIIFYYFLTVVHKPTQVIKIGNK